MTSDALFDLGAPALDGAITIATIDKATWAPWYESYHYQGPPGAATVYGAFAPDLAAAVAIQASPGVGGQSARYELEAWPGDWEISRVAVHPDAPPNTASRAIAAATKAHHARTGHEWLFSYADTGQGHHGGIYQALNAVYLGATEAAPGFVVDGRPVHTRTLYDWFGTNAYDDMKRLAAERGMTLERIDGLKTPKHLYILMIGGPASRRAIRKHLARWSLPYPKR